MVVGKPAPLLVHPSSARPECSLLGEFQKKWPTEQFFFVNRLDRETSGCVLVARTKGAARYFGKEMMERRIDKVYHAFVSGWPDWKETRVCAPLIRMADVGESLVWVRQIIHREGKESATRFVLEEKFIWGDARFSVVRCIPETGRMHQIRVHLASLEHPVVGDKIYNDDGVSYLEFLENGWTEELRNRLVLDRHALHASEVSFYWEGEKVTVSCPISRELEEFRIGE